MSSTAVSSTQSIVHDHAGRRERLRQLVAAGGMGSLIVGDLLNVEYLTGFTGSNAAVLIAASGPDGDRVCTDGRYITQVGEQVPDVTAVIARQCVEALVGVAAGVHDGPIGFEAHVVTVAELTAVRERLTGAAQGEDERLFPTAGVVESLREVKDAGEVELVRRACAIADEALAAILPSVSVGMTERQVARALEWEMYERGADGISFETIVATGENSAVPHHRPTDTVLRTGDFLKIDFGAVVAGYHSDMTRTFVLGQVQTWQRDVYEVVATAQRAGMAAMVAGAGLGDIDRAARDVIAGAGFADRYVHGLGHGVGLAIHEAPGVGKTATGTLRSGAVVTAEPGVYLPGRGGVRIEDTLVVGSGELIGSSEPDPRVLTRTTKDLTVI